LQSKQQIEKGEKIQGKKNRKGGKIQGECPSKNLEGKKSVGFSMFWKWGKRRGKE